MASPIPLSRALQKKDVRLVYLDSSPFCHSLAGLPQIPSDAPRYTVARSGDAPCHLPSSPPVEAVGLLDTAAEFRCLQEAAREIPCSPYGHRLLLQPLTASVRTLRSLLTVSGGAILHFGGHGASDGSLLFEHNPTNGAAHRIDYAVLADLFAAGHKDEPTLLACVLTCHSYRSGQAFVAAGVPHVVCTDGRVRDDHAAHFCYQFYLALFSGKSVGESFEIANRSLAADVAEDPPAHPPPHRRSVFLAPPEDPHDRGPTPFRLLGKGRHHHTRLFPSGGPSSCRTVARPASVLHNVPPACGPGEVVGREVDAHRLLSLFAQRPQPRVISLVGRTGVGKTALAIKVCRYSAVRCAHWGHIWWVDGDALRRECHLRRWSEESTASQEQRRWKSERSVLGGNSTTHNDEAGRGSAVACLLDALAKQLVLRSEGRTGGYSTPEELANALAQKHPSGEQQTLIVFDALDALLACPRFQATTVSLLNSLLKCENTSLFVTSEQSISSILRTSDPTSTEAPPPPLLPQVRETVIVLPPLDDSSTRTMLAHCVTSRKLEVAETGVASEDYDGDDALQEAAAAALVGNYWVGRTEGLPGRIAELGRLLEKTRLDRLGAEDVRHTVLADPGGSEVEGGRAPAPLSQARPSDVAATPGPNEPAGSDDSIVITKRQARIAVGVISCLLLSNIVVIGVCYVLLNPSKPSNSQPIFKLASSAPTMELTTNTAVSGNTTPGSVHYLTPSLVPSMGFGRSLPPSSEPTMGLSTNFPASTMIDDGATFATMTNPMSDPVSWSEFPANSPVSAPTTPEKGTSFLAPLMPPAVRPTKSRPPTPSPISQPTSSLCCSDRGSNSTFQMKFPTDSPTFAASTYSPTFAILDDLAGERTEAPNKYSMVFLFLLLILVDAAVLTWLRWRGYLSRSLFCVAEKIDSPCDEPLEHVEP